MYGSIWYTGKYVNGATIIVDGGLWLSRPRHIPKEEVKALSKVVEKKVRTSGFGVPSSSSKLWWHIWLCTSSVCSVPTDVTTHQYCCQFGNASWAESVDCLVEYVQTFTVAVIPNGLEINIGSELLPNTHVLSSKPSVQIIYENENVILKIQELAYPSCFNSLLILPPNVCRAWQIGSIELRKFIYV